MLQGLLTAQDNIDEVIHIIRTAYDDAKQKLMERFDLDDVQAQAILDRFKASKVVFESEKAVCWTVDGEYADEHQRVEINVVPRAVKIITAEEKTNYIEVKNN